MRRPLAAHLAAAALVLSLTACSGADGGNTAQATDASTPEAASPTPTQSESPTPTLTPTPTPEGPEVFVLGEAVEMPSSSITINKAKKVKVIDGDFGEKIEPEDGGTLWLLSMEWTNLANEAVEKVCWGPDTAEVRVYDTQDREMLLDDKSGFIPGNECSDGLMKGQSGKWFQAYHGLPDAKIGYATVQEFSGEPVAVVFSEDISLTWE